MFLVSTPLEFELFEHYHSMMRQFLGYEEYLEWKWSAFVEPLEFLGRFFKPEMLQYLEAQVLQQ